MVFICKGLKYIKGHETQNIYASSMVARKIGVRKLIVAQKYPNCKHMLAWIKKQ